MWMINPKLLCWKHLLGEHGEIHKHLPSLRRGVNVYGRFHPIVQIELWNIKPRHDDLVGEMLHRGFNHHSPVSDADVAKLFRNYPLYYYLTADRGRNMRDLMRRCERCKRRIRSYG